MLRPTPAFQDLIARAGLAPKDIIERAPISRSTYFAWLKPDIHPHRKGGMRRVNAWNITRVYEQATLFDEVPDRRRPYVSSVTRMRDSAGQLAQT